MLKHNDRRRMTPEMEHARGDRTTKQTIVGTICLALLIIIATLCFIAIRDNNETAIGILKDLALMLAGGVLAILAKTGIEAWQGNRPSGTPDNPVSTVVENTEDNSVPVHPQPEK